MPNHSPYSNWLPWDASAHGYKVDDLIIWVHYFMFALFIGWGIYFVMALAKFRSRQGHRASYELPKAKATKAVEVLVVIVEAVLLVVFSIPAWAAYKSKDQAPTAGNRFEVHAVGEQFAWNFHYPGKDGKFGARRPELVNPGEGNPLGLDDKDPNGKDDIVSPELHVPFNKDVYITITSKDVIHSFFIPIARVKQDAIPGIQIPIWFRPEKFDTDAVRKALASERSFDDKMFQKNMAGYVAMREYKDKDGKVVLKIGDLLTDAAVASIKATGATTLFAAPKAAAEVVCAQLCGDNHFQMKAPFYIDTEEEMNKWLASQAAPAPTSQPAGEFQE